MRSGLPRPAVTRLNPIDIIRRPMMIQMKAYGVTVLVPNRKTIIPVPVSRDPITLVSTLILNTSETNAHRVAYSGKDYLVARFRALEYGALYPRNDLRNRVKDLLLHHAHCCRLVLFDY